MSVTSWFSYFISHFRGRRVPVDSEVMRQVLEGINDQVEGINTDIENVVSSVNCSMPIETSIEVEEGVDGGSPILRVSNFSEFAKLFPSDGGCPIGFSFKSSGVEQFKFISKITEGVSSTSVVYFSAESEEPDWTIEKMAFGDITLTVPGFVVVVVN